MLFSLLLWVLSLIMGNAAKNNKVVKDMLTVRNDKYVVMTRDGARGRRFIFKQGKFFSDKVLTDYDMALIFENADIGFKTLALGGDTGVQIAINNYNLRLVGNANMFNFFGIMLMICMGVMKRK